MPTENQAVEVSVADAIFHRADGSDIVLKETAICDVCGGPATDFYEGQGWTGDGSWLDARIKRRVIEVRYTCGDHSNEVGNEFCDLYGSAANAQVADTLTPAVRRTRDQRLRDEDEGD